MKFPGLFAEKKLVYKYTGKSGLFWGEELVDSTDEVYQGLDCIRISNETVSVWITKTVGLRIIGLSINDPDDRGKHPWTHPDAAACHL